ncbi:MAG: uracil-DNA glycosylase [Syntrophorhabdaceae bacterium]|nr:uracil-DNA glycosylase [Syntrophorhabdaceae bacterium]
MGIDTYFYDRPGLLTFRSLKKSVLSCRKCALADTRLNVVFGEGNIRADIVFVGEAPGEEEDLQGRPFVGRAGKLLDRLIERAGLKREDVYICNVLKCRPPNNRDPEPREVEACKGYLFSLLDLIKPKMICTLGRHAYNTLLGVEESITRVRGNMSSYRGIPLLPTYHPSFLLRNPSKMGEAWDDMDKIKHMLTKLYR